MSPVFQLIDLRSDKTFVSFLLGQWVVPTQYVFFRKIKYTVFKLFIWQKILKFLTCENIEQNILILSL